MQTPTRILEPSSDVTNVLLPGKPQVSPPPSMTPAEREEASLKQLARQISTFSPGLAALLAAKGSNTFASQN